MQEHPVPQNVTGYEFHLIGQMTLKQFMEVAAGIVVAVLVYWTNLPLVFKYPLMAFVGLLGVALAFIPLEGRPLDRWFFAFIKSIYQPTMFFWKKTDTTPGVFTYTAPKNLDTSPQINYTPIRQSRLQEYVHTVASQEPDAPQDEESKAAQEVLKLFSEKTVQKTPTATTPTGSTVVIRPTVTVSPSDQTFIGKITEMKIAPLSAAPTVQKKADVKTTLLPEPGGVIQGVNTFGVGVKDGVTEDLVAKEEKKVAPRITDTMHTVLSAAQVAPSGETLRPTVALRDFPFPNKPTAPNMLAGMVMTQDNKIIDNAIITITRQSDNNPVRAIKTNTLGQFAIVTPLENGAYTLIVEKDGLRFDKYSLVLNNQVVEPIEMRANS